VGRPDARQRLRRATGTPLRQAYQAAFPELAAEFERRMRGELPADWTAYAAADIAEIAARGENIATRKASQNAIERLRTAACRN
jgi:transketolase